MTFPSKESLRNMQNGTYQCIACRKGKHYDCTKGTIMNSACKCIHKRVGGVR